MNYYKSELHFFSKSKNHIIHISCLVIIFFASNVLIADNDSTLSTLFDSAVVLYEKGEMDSCSLIIDKAKSYSEVSDFIDQSDNIFHELALFAFNHGRYEQAMYWFYISIDFKISVDSLNLAHDYLGISLAFLERGFADSALFYNKIARKSWENYPDNSLTTNLENNTGRVYMDLGDFDSALEHLLLALTNANLEKDTTNLIYINYNLGTLYQRLNKFDDALEYYLKGLELSKLTNNQEGLIYSYSIGLAYQQRGEYKTALSYNAMAIPACIKLDKLDDLANIYNNMSNVYMLMKKYDTATHILNKSIKISKEAGNFRQLGIAYANMGKTKELTKQYDSAIYYLILSKNIFSEHGHSNLESIALRMISDVYEANTDYENAFKYFKLHENIADSIINENVQNQLSEIKTKYETQEKEKENTYLKKDIEFEKRKSYLLTIIAIGLLVIGVISLILFYFIRRNTITKKQLAESEARRLENDLESQKRELTLGALSLSRNIEFINSLIDELKELADHVNDDGIQPLNNIVTKLAKQQSDNSWKEFEKRFSEIHNGFYSRLILEYPNISQNELKLSAFLKLGMNTKEICSITFQSVRAVEAARLRLRKKLNLTNGENLGLFLQKF